jgi:peroxiredoxin
MRPGMFIGKREFEVEGAMLQPGQLAPDFRLTANNWSVKTLADYAGKVKVFSIVPSRRRAVSIRKRPIWTKTSSC